MNLPLLLAFWAASATAFAADCRAVSGPATTVLIELYTSEGCSSCPPADRWLSAFARAPRDPGIVPIAFHVQYWDALGWKDRFGDPRFTGRQEAEAKVSGARFVYTPQVVVSGRDLPRWHDGAAFARAVDEVRRRPARATLEIAPHALADGSVSAAVTARLRPGLPGGRLALVVAVLQDGLSSRVTAGENRGERLAHDFVARDLSIAPISGERSTHTFEFKARPGWEASRLSVAAFLQDTGTGEVLQALSAAACPP